MKILLYKKISDLAPTGGPNGYLFNLKNGLDKINCNNICFLPGESNENTTSKSKIKRFVPKFIINKIRKSKDKKNSKNWIKMIENKYVFGTEQSELKKYDEYDAIHFHSTFELYDERKNLEKFKGKIILTSHSPKPAHLEIIDGLIERKVKNIDYYKEHLEKIDEYAFNSADYIIFPCEEAEEPYYNQWDKYKQIHELNKEKYRYVLSGIKGCSSKVSKFEIREKYGIPVDAFLISYVGRHNEVKGYDLLKEIGKKVLEKFSNIYFIIAGKEGPLYKLENERWVEVGWTNDPHSIISSSDLFVLPNKETYFDLVFLEVLSLGMPMLVTNTGGNKYFKNFDESGIFYFNNKEEAISSLDKILNMDKLKLTEMGNINKKIFEDNFNEKIFAENYVKLIDSLIKE